MPSQAANWKLKREQQEKQRRETARSYELKRESRKFDPNSPDPLDLEIEDHSGLKPDHASADPEDAQKFHEFLYGAREVQAKRNKPIDTEYISDRDNRNPMLVERMGGGYIRMSVPEEDR